jgi:hypothetical protein
VTDVPATATARVRELSRGGRRKTDALDAVAAASVAALHADAVPVAPEGPATVLAMLDERRSNLIIQRTRTVNQLHALLRDLLPGGASTDLTAEQAAALLSRIRPASPVERARKDLARDLVADIRALDVRLKDNRERIDKAVTDAQTSLTGLVGVGPIVAGLCRRRADRDRQRRQNQAPVVPQRRPQTQQRTAYNRADAGTHSHQARPPLLQPQDRRRQNT